VPYSTAIFHETARTGLSAARAAQGICASVFLVLFWCCAAWAAPAVYESRRPFQGLIRHDMAERAARAAADLDAMRHAMRILAREPALRFANSMVKEVRQEPPNLAGMARLLFSTRFLGAEAKGFPTAMEAAVRVTLVPPDEPLPYAVAAALAQPGLLALCSQAVSRQEALLAQYDAQSVPLLALPPATGGKRLDLLALEHTINGLQSIERYLSLLPLRRQMWENPLETREKLEQAHECDPQSPFVLVALAEVCLQIDRPAEALDHAVAAIRLTPDLYPAHDVKGAILLRQRLPILASGAFNDAISLAPRNPELYVHRAAAYLAQETLPDMCADFRSACALGDCSGYQWAKASDKCPGNDALNTEEAAAPPSAAPLPASGGVRRSVRKIPVTPVVPVPEAGFPDPAESSLAPHSPVSQSPARQ
jgi:tetratricopeptide (TPR) repeat protein